jgi:hypothetical protein
MASFWTELEEELGIEIPKVDQDAILRKGVTEFIKRDLRYWEIDGKTYPKKPEEFRRAFLRQITKAHFKIKEGKNEELSTSDQSEGNQDVTEES